MRFSRIGVFLLFGFVATQAVRDVYLGHLFGELGLFEVAFAAFGTATVVFGSVLLITGHRQFGLLAAHWKDVMAVNATTAIAWLCYFGSLRLITPAASNLAFSGVAPAAVLLFGALGLASRRSEAGSRAEKALHWALLATVGALALIVAAGHSGAAEMTATRGIAGVGLAAIAGFAITAEMIFAKRMNDAGIGALSIVGVRFSLVTLLAGCMVIRMQTPYAGMTIPGLVEHCLIFLMILIGPIYLAQKGLQLTGPLTSGVILATGPVATLALQSSVGGVSLTSAMLAVTGVYASLSVCAAILAALGRDSQGR